MVGGPAPSENTTSGLPGSGLEDLQLQGLTSSLMAQRIDTLLLLGLPACGKSVIRRYLSSVSQEVAELTFHVGMPTVQLDDFPYVHLMWRISQVTEDLGHEPVFFDSTRESFRDLRDFGTLIHLLNEDYAALGVQRLPAVRSPGKWIVDRLETAHVLAGMSAPFSQLDEGARTAVAAAIEDEAAPFAAQWCARSRPPDSTVVIELARGGPEGSDLPLDSPYGYAHALSLLSAELLHRAAILYVSVTPQDSRRRNRDRARPGAHGSILHHGVPEKAMRAAYGIDDLGWLIDHSDQPGTITVPAHESTFHLPAACFDNRRDLALFQREDPATWPTREVAQVHAALREAFGGLAMPSD